jgi:hypothetical protein
METSLGWNGAPRPALPRSWDGLCGVGRLMVLLIVHGLLILDGFDLGSRGFGAGS